MKTLKEEYIDSLRRFSEVMTNEILVSLEIKSITVMHEITKKPVPLPPKLLVKKLNETQYTMVGMEEIAKHLNELVMIRKMHNSSK